MKPEHVALDNSCHSRERPLTLVRIAGLRIYGQSNLSSTLRLEGVSHAGKRTRNHGEQVARLGEGILLSTMGSAWILRPIMHSQEL